MNDFTLFIRNPVLLTVILYWLLGSGYAIVDTYKKPKFLADKHIQEHYDWINGHQKRPSVIKIINKVIVSQIFLLVGIFIFGKIVGDMPLDFFDKEGFTAKRFFLEHSFFWSIESIFFYYIHRLFHTKWLYKYHAIHHEFKSPVAFATIYAHPLESIFGNVLPIIAGPALPWLLKINNYRPHYLSVYIYAVTGIFATVQHHSGYDIGATKFHDIHHQKLRGNYGNWGLLDRFHKTLL